MAAKNVIVSCAVTGSLHTPSMSPHPPITPGQIAAESIAPEMCSLNMGSLSKIVRILSEFGHGIAESAEARERLHLKGQSQVDL